MSRRFKYAHVDEIDIHLVTGHMRLAVSTADKARRNGYAFGSER